MVKDGYIVANHLVVNEESQFSLKVKLFLDDLLFVGVFIHFFIVEAVVIVLFLV